MFMSLLSKKSNLVTPSMVASLLSGICLVPAMADEQQDLLDLKQKMAGEREELLELKNTTVNLIDIFVQQGLLDKQKADQLVQAAKSKAAIDAKAQLAQESKQAQLKQEAALAEPAAPAKGKKDKSIKVAYVPDFVKDEIRQEVRAELKDEVVAQVKADAKNELWGVPAALPQWLDKVKLTFDMRIRGVNDSFADNNSPYLDYLAINREGGHLAAARHDDEYLQQEDRFRFSERFRVGMNIDIADHVKAGIRLATSNIRNPVSNDQALGNTGQSFEFAIDRGFIEYDYVDDQGNDWFSLYGGRFANPWVSTDVVYDPDLSFQGFAGTFRYRFNQDKPDVKAYQAAKTNDLGGRAGINMGPQSPDTVFATLGVFPLQELNETVSDKWLFGGQLGADWLVMRESRLKMAAAYYQYTNVRAKPNARNSFDNDWTAPEFIQKGNSMVPININDGFNDRCTSSDSQLHQGCLYGLASDFKIFNVTAMFDYAGFGKTHVMLTADYAKNLGYDASRIEHDFPGALVDNTDRSNAFQVRLDVGDQDVIKFNDWNVFLAYRYVQRDAVLDAFTESLFHLGGTDAKGWWIGGNYGLAKNTWLNLRWSSTDSIDGSSGNLALDKNGKLTGGKYSVDTAAIDLNVRF